MFNFDPNANFDDGSCFLPGCTDEYAINYNSDANINDESCIYCENELNYVQLVLNSLTFYDGAYGMEYTILNDGETIINGNGSEGSWSSDTTRLCLPDGCYEINVSDAYCCNYGYDWSIMDISGQAGSGGIFSLGNNGCEIGCMDSSAINFNQNAEIDDGSCEYYCDPFEDINITQISTNSVDLNWSYSQNINEISHLRIRYRESSIYGPYIDSNFLYINNEYGISSSIIASNIQSVSINNLIQNTEYVIQLKSFCQNTGFSDWHELFFRQSKK